MTVSQFKRYINKYAVVNRNKINYVHKSPLDMEFDSYKIIGEGLFNRVYKVEIGANSWVIKEGRDDLKVPLILNAYIPLPRTMLSRFYNIFGLNLMPTHKFALDQLDEYALLSKYFGYFDNTEEHSILKFDKTIIPKQKLIRNKVYRAIYNEDEFAEIILQYVKTFKNYKKIRKIFSKQYILTYNFLPKEDLILYSAKGLKKYIPLYQRKKQNYYIIQDWIDGYPFGKVKIENIMENQELVEKIIIFIILGIYFAYKERKVIDSKPDGNWLLSDDWFGKTGNIYIEKDLKGLKFIDTRWLWNHREGNFMQQGLGLSERIISEMGRYLLKYTEQYKG